MRSRSFLLVLVLVLGGCIGVAETPHDATVHEHPDPCRDGEAAAKSELEQGQFGFATFGLPLDCQSRVDRAAWERYEIANHWMGCVIDDDNGPFAECYNGVMSRAIDEAYGPNLLEDLRQEFCARELSPPGSD